MVRSVTCVVNVVGVCTTSRRCSRKISTWSLHTVICAVFSSASGTGGRLCLLSGCTKAQAVAGGHQERPNAEPEAEVQQA